MPNAIDMATLSDVKSWLNLSVATDDTLIGTLITDASSYLQDVLSRDIVSTVYTNEVYHGNGTNRLMVRQYPISAVASIVVTDPYTGVATTYTSGFWFDERTIYLQNGLFTQGGGNIKVTYTAGFTTVPYDIKRATIEMTAYLYRSRTRIGAVSKGLGGESVSINVTDLPPMVKKVIQQAQNVVPV